MAPKKHILAVKCDGRMSKSKKLQGAKAIAAITGMFAAGGAGHTAAAPLSLTGSFFPIVKCVMFMRKRHKTGLCAIMVSRRSSGDATSRNESNEVAIRPAI